jgi:hypothetical protein
MFYIDGAGKAPAYIVLNSTVNELRASTKATTDWGRE